jgi:hypothetical protein
MKSLLAFKKESPKMASRKEIAKRKQYIHDDTNRPDFTDKALDRRLRLARIPGVRPRSKTKDVPENPYRKRLTRTR